MAKKKPAAPQRASSVTDALATTSQDMRAVANDATDRRRDGPSHDEIAEAAYRRYLNRGGTHGQDLDDWVTAESELKNR